MDEGVRDLQTAADARSLARVLKQWTQEWDSAEAPGPSAGAGSPLADFVGVPIADERSVAAAVFDRTGLPLAMTEAFEKLELAEVFTRRLVLDRLQTQASGYGATDREEAPGADKLLYAFASGEAALNWRLPSDLRTAIEAHPGTLVVLTTTFPPDLAPLRDACRAYGLTGLQTRVTLEAIRTGSIRDAAAALKISHQTAREALAAALKRAGVTRLPSLVLRLTSHAIGVSPHDPERSVLLADAWGLSERQTMIAGLLAEGADRETAARTLGITLAVLKKDLEVLYALLGVSSAAGLARRVAEARALTWLTGETGGVGFVDAEPEPLRFVLRADRSRIAVSDYGPASGHAVLVTHSSMTTRIVSRRLVRALQRAGYRPIAIDRPGFGLSDPLPKALETDHPFQDAVDDVACVLTTLRIAKADLVSRGAAQFVVAVAASLPERIGQVVIVNPGPPYRHSGGARGPLAIMKRALIRNPSVAHALAPFLAAQLSHPRLARMLPEWTRGSPPDHAAAQDPEFVNDFFRSVRMFATGRFGGFLREQMAIAAAGEQPPFAGSAGWRVILGTSDVLYDPEVLLAYWRRVLPGADFKVVDGGGRFLAMTHAHLVVRALAEN